MGKHDTSGDGHKRDVDPSRIAKPKDEGGKHTETEGGDKGEEKK